MKLTVNVGVFLWYEAERALTCLKHSRVSMQTDGVLYEEGKQGQHMRHDAQVAQQILALSFSTRQKQIQWSFSCGAA